MKRFQILAPIVLACSCLCVNSAMADSGSLNAFEHKVLPVLVHVNAQGKVTQVSSSIELRPRFDRLLRESLDQMISKPATYHGHPVASQFVITLGMKATPRPDGRYDASLFYVSSKPVPSGSWLWEHVDGHRLALVNRDVLRDANRRRARGNRDYDVQRYQYQTTRTYSGMQAPTTYMSSSNQSFPSMSQGRSNPKGASSNPR